MPNVVRALAYLRITSFWNALKSRLRRLKQPKYLAGAVVGGAYLYFVFFRRVGASHGPGAAAAVGLPEAPTAVVIALAALLVTVIAVLCWIWPRARAALSFSEAEIGFLFPAPLSRRALVNYRLISSQIGIGLTALILALVSRPWTFISGGTVVRIVGWWIILGTLTLHFIGSSFAITRLLDRGVTAVRRRAAVFGVLAVAAIAVAAFWRGLPGPRAEDLAGMGAFMSYLGRLSRSGPLAWLLLPATWVVRPMFAADALSCLKALTPAALVYAAHYAWVLSAQVSFEEASIEKAQKRSARIAAIRAGNRVSLGRSEPKARRAPFALAAAGRPEIAFLWKNLLSTAEYLRPRTAFIAAATITIGGVWLRGHPDHSALGLTIGTMAMAGATYVLLIGPLFARQDFRRDLRNADMLKVYPLDARQIVVGEILTPAAILTVLLWLLLLTAALLVSPPDIPWLTPQLRASAAVGFALAVPLLCTLELLVANAAAMLFPAWVLTPRQRTAIGIEGMGLRILFLLGQLFVIFVALLPAGILALIVFVLSRWLLGVTGAAVCGAVAALAVLAAEVYGGTWWLAQRFEQFDLSAELRP